MLRRFLSPLTFMALALLLLTATLARPAAATIRYTVSLEHPEQHLFHVTMEIPNVHQEVQLQMAAWDALYQIRDFSSHVQQVSATSNDGPAQIEKLDKLTWKIHGNGTVTVHYATFWDDPGPFSSQLNPDHAFINPAMIFLYVPDRRSEDCSVQVTSLPDEWKVASSALQEATGLGAARSYHLSATGYDQLADSPIEASHFDEFVIHELTPPVHVVIHGDNWHRHDVENALRKICQYETRLMEGAPYDQYTFLFHIGKAAAGGGGGMEHANSTAISIGSDAFLPNISAHEFFHLWNVKRLRPATLEPLDHTREMYTRALWFAEGVTNTYGSYALVRTGLWNKQEFYQDLGSQISELEQRPAEQWQSAEQSSLDAWLEKYPLYNQPQASVSYYTKGQVLGVLLDILIRERTDNQRSLDDLLRTMNSDFAQQNKPYRDSLDVRLTAEKITGAKFDDFFDRYVAGADPLPYRQVLPLAGLDLHSYESVRGSLGFSVERDPTSIFVVRDVVPTSLAAQAGLRAGDEIVQWNAGDIPRRPDRWVLQKKPGEELHLRIRRGEKLQDLAFKLGEQRDTYYQIVEHPQTSDRAKRIRDGLLHGTTDPVTARNR